MNRLFSLMLLLCVTACTITPKPVESHHISIGLSGKPDSGLIAIVPAAVVPAVQTSGLPQPAAAPIAPAPATGYQIDARARDRYNALASLYGRDPHFAPSLVPDQGITVDAAGVIILDREGMRRFLLLSEWHRMGRLPPKRPLLERLFK
jgi:hypothetical protein